MLLFLMFPVLLFPYIYIRSREKSKYLIAKYAKSYSFDCRYNNFNNNSNNNNNVNTNSNVGLPLFHYEQHPKSPNMSTFKRDNCKPAVLFFVQNFYCHWVYCSFPQTLRTVVGPNLKQNLQTGCELSPVIISESSFIRIQTLSLTKYGSRM
jgi:hypothetical protein